MLPYFPLRRALALLFLLAYNAVAQAASIWQQAMPLTVNALTSGTFAGAANNLSNYSFHTGSGGSTGSTTFSDVERVYRFDLTVPRYIEVPQNLPGFRVLLLKDSSAATGLGYGDGTEDVGGRNYLTAGRYYISVERITAGSTAFSFTLGSYINRYGGNFSFTRASATPVSCGQTINSTLAGQADHIGFYIYSQDPTYSNGAPDTGPDRQFSFTLTQASYVRVLDRGQTNYAFYILRDTTNAPTLSGLLQPGTYYISVELGAALTVGPFKMEIQCGPTPFVPNQIASGGTLMQPGVGYAGSLQGRASQVDLYNLIYTFSQNFKVRFPAEAEGPDATYRIQVPAGASTTVIRRRTAPRHGFTVLDQSGRSDSLRSIPVDKNPIEALSLSPGNYFMVVEQASAAATDLYSYDYQSYRPATAQGVVGGDVAFGGSSLEMNGYAFSNYHDGGTQFYAFNPNHYIRLKPDSVMSLSFTHSGGTAAQDTLFGDFNFDGDFKDAGEVLYASTAAAPTRSTSINLASQGFAYPGALGQHVVLRAKTGGATGSVTDFIVYLVGPAFVPTLPSIWHNAPSLSCGIYSAIDMNLGTTALTNYSFTSNMSPYGGAANFPGKERIFSFDLAQDMLVSFNNQSSDVRGIFLNDSNTASARGNADLSSFQFPGYQPSYFFRAGRHYVVAEQLSTNQFPVFGFQCQAAPVPFQAFTRASAQTITIGVVTSGTLTSATNHISSYSDGYTHNNATPGRDVQYKFTLTDTSYVTIRNKQGHGHQLMLLRDTTNYGFIGGNSILVNGVFTSVQSTNGSTTPPVPYTRLPPGTYYLSVEQFDASPTDPYEILIQATPTKIPETFTVTPVGSLPLGGSVSGTLAGRSSSYDFFRVSYALIQFGAESATGPDIAYSLNVANDNTTKVIRKRTNTRQSLIFLDAAGNNVRQRQYNSPLLQLPVSPGNYTLLVEQGSGTAADPYAFDYQRYVPKTPAALSRHPSIHLGNAVELATSTGAYVYNSYIFAEGNYNYSPPVSPILRIKPDSATSLTLTANASLTYQDTLYADFNFDGDFADAGERVYASATAAASRNVPITIASSTLGVSGARGLPIVMRLVTMQAGSTSGQVIDFPVYIAPGAATPPSIYTHATTIACGDTVRGTFTGAVNNITTYELHSGSGADLGSVNYPAADRIFQVSVPANSYLNLWTTDPASANFKFILLSDSTPTQASTFANPTQYPGGRYYAVIEQISGAAATPFAFSLSCGARPAGPEYKFTRASATPIACGTSIRATLAGQADKIKDYTDEGTEYAPGYLFYTNHAGIGADKQYTFTLADSAYVLIKNNLQTGHQINLLRDTSSYSFILGGDILVNGYFYQVFSNHSTDYFRKMGPGRYYISVEQFTAGISEPYELSVQCSAMPVQRGIPVSGGTLLQEGTVYSGSLASKPSHIDYYGPLYDEQGRVFKGATGPDDVYRLTVPASSYTVVRRRTQARHGFTLLRSPGRSDSLVQPLTDAFTYSNRYLFDKNPIDYLDVSPGNYTLMVEQASASVTDPYSYDVRSYPKLPYPSGSDGNALGLSFNGKVVSSGNYQGHKISDYHNELPDVNTVNEQANFATLRSDTVTTLSYTWSDQGFPATNQPFLDTLYADFNFDGDFTDAGERLYASSQATRTVTYRFTIPASGPFLAAKGKAVVLRSRSAHPGMAANYTRDFFVFVSGPAEVPALPFQIAYFTPGGGPIGERVRIHGFGLGAVTQVFFGAAQATQIGVSGDTMVTAIVPPGATTARITVKTATGAQAQSGAYFVMTGNQALISSFAPQAGKVGDTVRIRGRRLSLTTNVLFNGARAAFTAPSDSLVIAIVPNGATTGKIQLIAGSVVSTATDYIISLPPVITGLAPGGGLAGDKLRIRGRGLAAVTRIFIGTVAAGTLYHSGDSLITLIVPAGVSTSRISATAPTGTAVSGPYFVVFPYPFASVSDISPRQGPVGTTITIHGTRLGTSRYARFGLATAASAVSILSDTVVTSVVPANAVSGYVEVVTRYNAARPPYNFTLTGSMLAEFREGEEQAALPGKLLLYPNPSRGKAILQLIHAQASQAYALEIYSADGKAAHTSTLSGGDLSQGIALPDNVAKGVYQIRLTSSGFVQSVRLVVE